MVSWVSVLRTLLVCVLMACLDCVFAFVSWLCVLIMCLDSWFSALYVYLFGFKPVLLLTQEIYASTNDGLPCEPWHPRQRAIVGRSEFLWHARDREGRFRREHQGSSCTAFVGVPLREPTNGKMHTEGTSMGRGHVWRVQRTYRSTGRDVWSVAENSSTREQCALWGT